MNSTCSPAWVNLYCGLLSNFFVAYSSFMSTPSLCVPTAPRTAQVLPEEQRLHWLKDTLPKSCQTLNLSLLLRHHLKLIELAGDPTHDPEFTFSDGTGNEIWEPWRWMTRFLCSHAVHQEGEISQQQKGNITFNHTCETNTLSTQAQWRKWWQENHWELMKAT